MRPEAATNRLAAESSAYLRQHMHNPVDWYAWGPEALERAAREDRPLLVSIGYSACHWCHVMEHESFENPSIAALMNQHFVCIKVDREERPDVDQLYMDTVLRLTGHGGWPLTVFCAPDGRPFYGGTYYPPEARHGLPGFPQVLETIARAYREDRAQVDETAERILTALRARPAGEADGLPGSEALVEAARRLLAGADRVHGGLGGAPKFPTPTSLALLLAAQDHLPGGEARDAQAFLEFSCQEMARRGLYDQLAGGFHRYCVDEHWGVPHFEKMLYDQGQLLSLYAEVWRRGGGQDDDFCWPIRETADWLRREMRSPAGGFYASQDADSEGVEGRFYVWTPAQIESVLGAEAGALFCRHYAVSEEGNFEHGSSVLWDEPRQPRKELREEREQLLAARAERVRPGTDEKRLAAWNGLTISGLAQAGALLGDETLLADARAACDDVLTHLVDAAGRLQRVARAGASPVPAFLDDLAAMLAACLDLHRAGAGPDYLERALGFAEQIRAHFFDATEGDLFLAADDGERLAHRPRSDHDGATPHSAGHAVLGLLRAATLSGRVPLREVAERVLRSNAPALERSPLGFPTLLRAGAWHEQGLSVAVVIGAEHDPARRALAQAARRSLAPEEAVVVVAPDATAPAGLDPSWLAGRSAIDGRATAYVCRGTHCSLPVTEASQLEALPRSSPA